ncbi:MAG: hypothetical protein ASARMPREDX12_006088 [Alectoria sarmentosa]|nr:MAG: hypothetical protein ASARMPREDX12_006088 [Alectoria sarmentosa]
MAKETRRRSSWLKSVLIPFWIIQLLFMCILLGAQIWAALTGLEASGLLQIIICAVCIILDVTEIILFARGTLQPITYLVLQCVKTTLWFIIFLIAAVGGVREESVPGESGDVALILLSGLIEAVVLLRGDYVAYISTLIYGSVIYHRHRHFISPLDHEHYDRFHNSPYGEAGIVEARYQRNDVHGQHTDEDGPMGPFENAGLEHVSRPSPGYELEAGDGWGGRGA